MCLRFFFERCMRFSIEYPSNPSMSLQYSSTTAVYALGHLRSHESRTIPVQERKRRKCAEALGCGTRLRRDRFSVKFAASFRDDARTELYEVTRIRVYIYIYIYISPADLTMTCWIFRSNSQRHLPRASFAKSFYSALR